MRVFHNHRIPSGLGVLLFCLIFTLEILAAGYEGKRVKVFLKDGRTLDGVVGEEKTDRILLKRTYAQIWLLLKDVTKIDVLPDPIEVYNKKAAECKTADDWVKLARWCRGGDVNLPDKVRECLDKAVELDPEHAEARKLRGDVKVGGKWYDEETGNKKLGRVKYKGKWISKKDYEREKRRDDLKKNKYIKKYLEQIEEREGRPWASVKPIETTNYFVKCNSTEEVAGAYSQLMEDLYDAYDELFSETEFPRYSTDKGKIFIFRNHDEFMDFTMYGPGIGGFYSHLDHSVRAYHGSFGVTGSTEMVLAHEATHQFQGTFMKNMRSVPTWVIEGMAVYYGDGTKFSKRGLELHQIPRDRLHTLKDAIRHKRYRPLRQLVRTPQWGFGPFYDHGWGVIYWCLQGQKYGVHDGSGKRAWDKYLHHVSNELPAASEIQNMGKHLDEEGAYFEKLLLTETGYETIDAWETDYKDFIMNKLQLEALGTWSGMNWDGSGVGIQLKFYPRSKLGLKEVATDDLRMEFREAAALYSESKDLRVWLGVDANRLELTKEEEVLNLAKSYISGYFKNPQFVEEPKLESFKGVSDIALVRAEFHGKFNKRQESGQRGAAAKGAGKGEKGEGAEGNPAGSVNTKKTYTVCVAYIVTTDKIYMLSAAGDEASIARIKPSFDKLIDSAKLTF